MSTFSAAAAGTTAIFGPGPSGSALSAANSIITTPPPASASSNLIPNSAGTTSTSTPTSTSTSASTSTSTSTGSSDIIAGSVVGIVVLLVALVVFWFRGRRWLSSKKATLDENPPYGPPHEKPMHSMTTTMPVTSSNQAA